MWWIFRYYINIYMMPWCMKKYPTIQVLKLCPSWKAALLQAVSNDNAEEVGFMKLPIRYLPWSFYRPVDFVFHEKYIIFKMAHVPAMFHKKKVWLKKRCLRHAEEVNMEWIYNAFSKRWTKKHIDSDWKNHGNPGTGSHPDRLGGVVPFSPIMGVEICIIFDILEY